MGFNSGLKGLMNGGIINYVTRLHLVYLFLLKQINNLLIICVSYVRRCKKLPENGLRKIELCSFD
jgi:Na+-transporting methylmalonyl-CoA/oxaloacetate decarboxylase beta subunit